MSTKLKAKITYELHYENETTKLKVDLRQEISLSVPD